MRAICIKEDISHKYKVGDSIKVVKDDLPPMGSGRYGRDIIILNEICYTSIDSDYFKKYFRLIETVRDHVEDMQKWEMTNDQREWISRDGKFNFRTGVVTNDYYLAKQIFEREFKNNNEYVVRYVCSKSKMILEYQSGESMVWIKCNQNSRGHKFNGAYIDENIDIDVLNMLIKPMFVISDGNRIKILQDELKEENNE